ncbi:MAG: tetratricopeptide repeat protein, partial [Anaerolineaceae bacterium]|nr:tetratricopeptide repeat protein [Anaerolineaceae bacterium]
MAEIRLQEYTAKIKELIRHDRHDEAIAHCQHILRHYPRHIETYYLLGEACLEKRMVREAIEFFQRTLSADPEYFLARVGLGIVYDEQGALLEAIWQMERAFELMPGNTEVRRELQRLYAQRDGVEKTRLKLTRGALGRLYSRNGLYEQAIGEFHAILRQDPELPDIQLALIEALWREGRRVEAVESCLDLLEALPNCLKANLILGTIWTQGGHEDPGLEKLEVARALDPENRMAQELFGSDSPLPPEEVRLEELVPEAGLALVPAAEERALAPWEVEGEERALEVQEEAEAGEETPDWLRDVGLVAEGEGEEEGEAPPPEVAAAEPAPGEAMPPWLQDLMGEEGEAGPLPEAAAPEEDRGDHPPSPDWLEELESAEPGEPSPLSGIGLAAGAAALPAEPAAGEEEPAAALEEETEAELPDWLEELGVPRRSVPLAGEGLPGEEELEELPDWLRELRPDQEELAPPVTAAEAEGVAGPDEERELPAVEPEAAAAGPVAEEVEEVPDWLRDLGLEAEAQEIEAQAEAELPAVEVPEGEEAPPPGEEVPDRLLALRMPEAEAPAAEVEEPEGPAAEEVPAWLEDLGMPEEAEAPAVEAPVAEGRVEPGVPAGEVPESLRALVEAGILAEEDLAEAMA